MKQMKRIFRDKWIYIFLWLNIHAVAVVNGQNSYYIDDVASHGNGTKSNPFNSFYQIRNLLQAGDTLFVMPGDYNISQPIHFFNSGELGKQIVIKADDPGDRPSITIGNQNDAVVLIREDYYVFDGLILNGNYSSMGLINLESGNNNVIKNCIIRRGTNEGISLKFADNTLIEGCEIYYFLRSDFNNPKDAHGIEIKNSTNITIRNCNIHHTSGDCIQVDPSFTTPLWDNVLIEDCVLWTGPLPANEAQFKAGECPGENAIDTKTDPSQDINVYRPKITIRNVEAYGYKNEDGKVFIKNRAAFNIKHNVEAIIENCVLHDNKIAFRLRGPYEWSGYYWAEGAIVTITNSIAYNNEQAVWFERDIKKVHLYNCTFDKRPDDKYFTPASGGYDPAGFVMKNCAFVNSKPEAASVTHSNVVATPDDFSDYSGHDYSLSKNSNLINAGLNIPEILQHDIAGSLRTDGTFDIGAFEYAGPVSSSSLIPAYKLDAYPNPTSGLVYFKNENNSDKAVKKIEVFNSTGEQLLTISEGLSANSSVDISLLPTGLYFMKFSTEASSENEILKIVKLQNR
ncbi:T9SS C-terminal target domain-containing protein [Mariniphaga sediminis]|uniref:T9SS C-terminal target domain-containing protein n=3 Tax=Mariniphaga sediminis TaxID=1628158 RepID=A0A399D165_9BACT|nr:T9SS C-terminal target domain-containing protein [Mariniphaga sediminis]